MRIKTTSKVGEEAAIRQEKQDHPKSPAVRATVLLSLDGGWRWLQRRSGKRAGRRTYAFVG